MIYRTYTIVLFVALILEFCDICHMKTIDNSNFDTLAEFSRSCLINYCAGDKSAYACIMLPISGAHVKKVCLTCTVIMKILVTAGESCYSIITRRRLGVNLGSVDRASSGKYAKMV